MFNIHPQQVLERTDELIKNGGELESHPHADQQIVQQIMGKIKQLMSDFDERLGKRKKKLDESVTLHRLIESVSSSSHMTCT